MTMDDIDKKRELVTGRLSKREDERIADAMLRKSERDATAASNESFDYFDTKFSQIKDDIELKLQNSFAQPKSNLGDYFDNLVLETQNLQKFVSDSAVFLTSRMTQNSQTLITSLQNSIQTKREELLPKKKFAFKSKKKEPVAEKSNVSKEVVERKVKVEIADCNFANKSNENLTMTSSELNYKDVALSNLSNCCVKLLGSPSAIHVNKLVNCTVLCGPVSGSIFIDDCSNCTFALSCQQLRIHNTTKTDFYIHVTSKAIIEDCTEVHFAPNSWTYSGIDGDYGISGLDSSINNWSDVDDFNWLASDKKSPNWDTIPETSRKERFD